MRHGYWNGHHKARFEASGPYQETHQVTRQTEDHVSRTRIKRLRMALVFIRDHAPDLCTRLYAESALESDDVLS